jgi:hypothetical protein
MVTSIIGKEAGEVQPVCGVSVAAGLGPWERMGLSVEVLARREPLSRLARQEGVSRKFLYQQGRKATQALEGAFAPPPEGDRVLFHLPVTHNWIRQFVLAQVLLGHSSFRGVIEILEAVLDYRDLSLGTIHNIVAAALPRARAANQAQDLRGIRVGAHDEIYQVRRPVLVGADVPSTYCYLLAEEDHCDETTWGVHLLDLEPQGLHPDYTVADGGAALRAGQAAAWEKVPCHGDVFHAERELGKLAIYLEHRARGCTSARAKLEHQMERRRRHKRGHQLCRRLGAARKVERAAVALAEDVRILVDWMQKDILALAGPGLSTREELFDFLVTELAAREGLCPHRIGPVRRALEGQRDQLLAFSGVLEERFQELGARWGVPSFRVQQVCELEGIDIHTTVYWQREGQLRRGLGPKFLPLREAVRQVMADTPRASSVIENLNSRLRNYFFLRREIGNDYLDLLRFFLNHHRFGRSQWPQRVGKSPSELLSGRSHPHWLEMLGFPRFHRSAVSPRSNRN